MVSANIADTGWAIQSAKGTPATASVYRSRLAGGDQPVQMRTEQWLDETTAQRMRTTRYVESVGISAAPQLFVRPRMLASIFYGVLGATSPAGAGPYVHTAVPADTLPYFTFWNYLADLLYGRSADCKITQIVLHGESGKPLMLTPTIMGLHPVSKDAAETTADVEIADTFMHYDGAGALKLEGTAIGHIRSFDLTINNNGQTVPGDDISPYDIAETRLEVTLRTTQLVENVSLWNRIHYGSASPAADAEPSRDVLMLGPSPISIDFLWTRVAASPGPERSAQVQIPQVICDPFKLTATVNPEPLLQDVTYHAVQPDSDPSITAKVTNGDATVAV